MVDPTGLSWNHLGGALVEAKAIWAVASTALSTVVGRSPIPEWQADT